MTEEEARLILQSYRSGEEDDDPQVAEALHKATESPEMTRWLAEEQAFDRAIAAHLEAVPAPFGLKTRILATNAPKASRGWLPWFATLTAAAVAFLLLAQGAGWWRTSKQVAGSPAEYAREMASFIQLSPSLEMQSNNLGEIKNWLQKRNMAPMKVPAQLAALAPVGCRILSFREQDVTLICFRREGDRLAHLFTVNRAALPNVKPGDKPIFENEKGWMTATWAEGDQVYMIAMQGGRAAIEKYLPDA